VPIYAGGGPHRLRQPSVTVLQMVAREPGAFVTDAEVLQEILHVYVARREWPAGRIVFDGFLDLMLGRIDGMQVADVVAAADLAASFPSLAARDSIHLAVMNRLGVTQIVTADAGFDLIPGIERLDPARFDEWRDSVLSDGA
jgi:predicted nucleic acid-binding protein